MTLARSESLPCISGALKPGVPRSTRKPLTWSSSLRAHTTATSAIEPLVIHIFEPSSTQPPPRRFARVRIDAGIRSRASGSVRPKQPIVSPLAMPGSQRCFCSSPPQRWIANIASDPCTEQNERSPAVARLELHARQPVRGRRRAGAAVAVQVHARAGPSLPSSPAIPSGSVPVLEVSGDVRQELLAHVPANGVADQPLLVVELGVEGQRIEGVEGGQRGGGGHAHQPSGGRRARRPSASRSAAAARSCCWRAAAGRSSRSRSSGVSGGYGRSSTFRPGVRNVLIIGSALNQECEPPDEPWQPASLRLWMP